MRDVKTRMKEGGRAAATVAKDLSKKAAHQVAMAADDVMVKLGDAAKKRQRARRGSALKTAGKVALVLGAGAATAIGAKRVLARANGRSGKRK